MDSDDEIPTLIEHDQNKNSIDNATSTRVPLTIISGFLGAGKSTLLKRILTERHGYRIAVIMNEFGDTAVSTQDIEAKTINVSSANDPTAEQSEEFLELANGCLCCSIKDSGIAAIEKLMLRKGAFDYILLETTGLADPGPIASLFWHNEEFATGLGRDIVLDGVVCVVDAVFGKQQMEEDHSTDTLHIGESLRQIAASDVILLNKVDLVPSDTLENVEQLIGKINPAAPVYRTIRGEINLKHIIGISAYASLPKVRQQISLTSKPCHTHDHGGENDTCSHNHPDATHYELRGISSLQVAFPALAKSHLDRFDEWIRTVLWENRLPDRDEQLEIQVLRCKGVLILETGEEYVLQGVRNMYELEKVDVKVQDTMGIPDPGKIVLIGKNLTDVVRLSLESVLTNNP
ncbi:hypothetical protein AX17_005200 [Amanita inopinata Kibby_2008]|nr:hypothetical protein AX17_005200 [Amanita inopinata Kibby_2008]